MPKNCARNIMENRLNLFFSLNFLIQKKKKKLSELKELCIYFKHF